MFTCSLAVSSVVGQTIKELEEQRKRALQQLETTNKVLKQTKKTQESSLNKLVIINRSIKERTNLINTIDREIYALNREMNRLRAETKKLESEMEIY